MQTTTVIVGTKYYGAKAITALGQLRVGDPVRLERDKESVHDPNAIKCYALSVFVGYVPRQANWRLSEILDRGCAMSAQIVRVGQVQGNRVITAPVIRIDWTEAQL